jgi:hypothetical protein
MAEFGGENADPARPDRAQGKAEADRGLIVRRPERDRRDSPVFIRTAHQKRRTQMKTS